MRILSLFEPNDYWCMEGKHIHMATDHAYSELNVDLIVFWGGEDISPYLYGERPAHTAASYKPTYRDSTEQRIFNMAVNQNIPMLGICRGAQMLCALNGQKLWQDVNRHGGAHKVDTLDTNQSFMVTSTHHQMMRKMNDDMQVLAHTSLSTYRLSGNEEESEYFPGEDIEIAYFPKSRCLAVQGHPEYLPKTSDFTKYVVGALKRHLNVEL